MTLQKHLTKYGLTVNYFKDSAIEKTELDKALETAAQQIEKDILELIIGKDEPVLNPDIPRGASWHNRMTRNDLRAELRLKLKEYIAIEK